MTATKRTKDDSRSSAASKQSTSRKTKSTAHKPTASEKQITKLEERIVTMEAELEVARTAQQSAEDRMLRVVAEFENAKRRQERDADRSLSFARDKLIMGLLPLVDNVRRSARYEEEHQDSDSHQEGMRIIYDQMKKYLAESAGVESFEPLGEAFNPDQHEAMMVRPVENDEKPGLVVEVFEAGYRAGDRILRPAKVVVSE